MRKAWISPAAGAWYQNSRMTLEYDMEHFKREISVLRKRNICAVVVPHAAYRFSGKTAARVYLRLDARQYDRIVILAPSHFEELRNQISVPDATHVITPLGELRMDLVWLRRLRELPFVTHLPSAHTREHSDQIQLPMIQSYVSRRLPVACLICGQFDAHTLLETAEALRPLVDSRTLLVVSSDFTHFGANFGDLPSLPSAATLGHEGGDNGNMFELFASGNLKDFMRYLKYLGHRLCSRDPLPLLMALMPQGAKVSRIGDSAPEGTQYAGAWVEGQWPVPPYVPARPISPVNPKGTNPCPKQN